MILIYIYIDILWLCSMFRAWYHPKPPQRPPPLEASNQTSVYERSAFRPSTISHLAWHQLRLTRCINLHNIFTWSKLQKMFLKQGYWTPWSAWWSIPWTRLPTCYTCWLRPRKPIHHPTVKAAHSKALTGVMATGIHFVVASKSRLFR